MDADIVCISHLWWDWVWQRPQQLISRLARDHRVFWAEEPHIEIGPALEGFEVRRESTGVDVGRLVYRSDAETFWRRLNESRRDGGQPFAISDRITEASLLFDSFAQPRLEREVVEHVARWRKGPLVLWLYTPAVVRFIDSLEPDLVVYDVMDELAAFRYAPPLLQEQERELLQRADLVFCGGPSLYEARRSRNPAVHLFPSGVDEAHFATALDERLEMPEAVRDLPKPRIGFFGVIDERMDLELLTAIAGARPDWSWLMVGPVLKIPEAALPRGPNIHYLGKQPYEALPAYLKSFDVAMMPFAINEATRFISPTKTLEYMAAGRQVVSTPIPDVVSMYGSVVRIAATADQFVAQVASALAETHSDRAERAGRQAQLLTRYSWDGIVDEMHALITDRLERCTSRGMPNESRLPTDVSGGGS
ncbi:glycosyltransferase family 1 protein [soil metagenome]